jgi:hypothetical protein
VPDSVLLIGAHVTGRARALRVAMGRAPRRLGRFSPPAVLGPLRLARRRALFRGRVASPRFRLRRLSAGRAAARGRRPGGGAGIPGRPPAPAADHRRGPGCPGGAHRPRARCIVARAGVGRPSTAPFARLYRLQRALSRPRSTSSGGSSRCWSSLACCVPATSACGSCSASSSVSAWRQSTRWPLCRRPSTWASCSRTAGRYY